MELISKEELINKINAYMITTPDVTMVRKLINELPVIESRPKGKWVRITQGAIPEQYICTFCHRTVESYGIEGLLSIRYPYCHCGADMREEETWHTSKGDVEMPKGMFDEIYNDYEE